MSWKILKKINQQHQSQEDLELWKALNYGQYGIWYGIYTVLGYVLMLKNGLEFEWEYAACCEDYTYVFIRCVLLESRIVRYRIKNKVPYHKRVT